MIVFFFPVAGCSLYYDPVMAANAAQAQVHAAQAHAVQQAHAAQAHVAQQAHAAQVSMPTDQAFRLQVRKSTCQRYFRNFSRARNLKAKKYPMNWGTRRKGPLMASASWSDASPSHPSIHPSDEFQFRWRETNLPTTPAICIHT